MKAPFRNTESRSVRQYLRPLLVGLLWAGVGVYVLWTGFAVHRERSARQVRGVEVEVVDSTSQGYLVTGQQVKRWIAQSGIATRGTAVDEVDLTAIERLIARNGFVDRVAAYVTGPGILHVTITPREPLLRLLTDGRNEYVTSEGYVFEAPRASSLYVPVVTGSYRPPFPASYAGDVRAYIDRCKREIDERIDELERSKYPVYRREQAYEQEYTKIRRQRLKRRWWKGESAEEFDKRVDRLLADKARARRTWRYRTQVIRAELERIEEQQETERRKQKKLEKSYEDFMKLLTFVETVEDDDFWRSEVVQIAAHTTPSGALEVELTPRSGRFTILFGRLEEVDRKLDKLMRFYRNGLSTLGWETYRSIDIRYRNQVVCKK